MSDLARKRFEKAATCKEAKPADMLESIAHDFRTGQDTTTQYAIVIRAYIDEEGLHFSFEQAGTFNIAERVGLLASVTQKLAL